MPHPIAPATVKPIPEGLPATLRPLGALPAEEAQDRFWNLAALMVTALIAVGAGGLWAYSKVRESLQSVRAAGLTALLEAEAGGMVIWIEEKKRDAERWASTPDVQRAAADIVKLQAGGAAPAVVCRSAPRRALMEEIAPYVIMEEAVAFNLVLADGTLVASNNEALCGRRIASGDFMSRLAPVFDGRTVFIRPFSERERLPDVPLARDRSLVWVETPVRDERGRVIAALGFGRVAEERFGKLLALTGSQGTREAYAFDRQGRMLTQSRFVGDLRAANMLAPDDSGILRLAVRDPGGDVLEGFRPAAGAQSPLTRLVEEALASHAGATGGEQGAVLEPYRNYRGASVIGAFQWLPEKEMAVAVEIEAREAFAPLEYVRIAFGGLFAFLLVSIAAAGASSLWAVRLRLRESRRMGPYELEREIGEGGMSRVYLARHQLLKRPTAVKVLKTALASDEVVTRFGREVQLCSQLTHPNTIEIYDYGRTRDGTFYYAMEYLRGTTLEELVRRDGPMPPGRVLHALLQVCGSLSEAHQRGLVHRDVKPHNLMLCVRGGQYDVIKVVDFGLVKETHNPHTRDITQFARVLGTPQYMSPERLRNPADADSRSDVYSLGAVAFFLLTGRHAFEGGSDHDVVYRILNAPAPTLAEAGAVDAPAELESLVARCLAKEREARPSSMEEIAAVLAALARDHPWTTAQAAAWWRSHAAEFGVEIRGQTPISPGEIGV